MISGAMHGILFTLFLLSFCLESSGRVCYRREYYKKKETRGCYLFGWWRCSKYKSVTRSRYACCSGWVYESTGCNYAVCAGRTNLKGACHRRYSNDKIIYRGGRTQTFGGGTCTEPNKCEECNHGFYNDGRGYCSICPRINHCNYRSCTSVSNNHCEYCEGEILDKLYWRAYTRHKDKHGNDDSFMKNCIQACSWRKDSNRCYPGTCVNEIATSCNCTEGFGGKHCQTITKDSEIKFAMAKFLSANPTDDPVETPEDPNDPIPRETKWTNQIAISHAVLNVTAIFRVNNSAHPPSVTGREHFVTGFKYGINNGVLKLTLKRDGNTTIPPIARGCRVNKELPTPDEYLCRESNVQFNEWNEHLPFQHGDIVTFTLQITNGGYLFYIDRDAYPDNPEKAPRIREDFIGRTVNRDFVVQWDLVPPYHQCVDINGLKCVTSPVFTQEVTNKVRSNAYETRTDKNLVNSYILKLLLLV